MSTSFFSVGGLAFVADDDDEATGFDFGTELDAGLEAALAEKSAALGFAAGLRVDLEDSAAGLLFFELEAGESLFR